MPSKSVPAQSGKRGAGRYGSRTAYTKKRHEVIIKAILAGNTRTNAFRLTGLHPDSVFDWLGMARKEIAAGEIKHPEYVKLLEEIEFAEACFENDQVGIVKAAADAGTWQAAAWWLERRKPQDYGKNREVVPEQQGAIPQVNILILEDPDARTASRELLRRVAGGRADLALGTGSVREPAEDS